MTVTEVNLDFDRQSRTGLAEAVLCEGKTQAQLQTILPPGSGRRQTHVVYPP